jgi:hypothetical protein
VEGGSVLSAYLIGSASGPAPPPSGSDGYDADTLLVSLLRQLESGRSHR